MLLNASMKTYTLDNLPQCYFLQELIRNNKVIDETGKASGQTLKKDVRAELFTTFFC